MANLQYIGARYVPKFFENPNDHSNDWLSGELYEALMIVTYNDDSYTSKKVVPKTIGNPKDNPEYWVCTTKYSAAIVALQNSVADLDAFVGDGPLVTNAQVITDAINELHSDFNCLFVSDYIEETDNGDIGLAIQRCVDLAANGRTHSTKIILPEGRFYIRTPVFIDKKEGLIIEGAGRLNTVLIASGNMLYNDTTGYPDSYAKNAFFIVALDRDYESGTDHSVYGYAAYYLTFKDFSMIDPLERKSISAIFGYGIANSCYQNINCNGLKYFIEFGVASSQGLTTSVGAWTTRIDGIVVKNGKGFTHIDRGTSVTYLNCSVNGCDEGFEIKTQYTDLIACTCEVWDKDEYAYNFDNAPCVNVINCGCEQGHGGIIYVNGNQTSVNFIGCFFTGVISNDSILNADNMNLISNGASVVFNNSALNLLKIVEGVQSVQRLNISASSRVNIIGLGRYTGNIFRPYTGSIYDYIKVSADSVLSIPEFSGEISKADWIAESMTTSGDQLTDEFTLHPGMYHIILDYPVIDGGTTSIATSLHATSGVFEKVTKAATFMGGSYAQQNVIIKCSADVTLDFVAAGTVTRSFTGINNAGVTIVRMK